MVKVTVIESQCMETNHPVNEYRQYRAPAEHGKSFVEPPMHQVASVMASNASTYGGYGAFFESLRKRARVQLVDDAIAYTSAYRDVDWLPEDASQRPILMAGHQPALFHPGVWFKNFALDHLAKQNGAVAINLVIDNDVAASRSIRVVSLDRSSGQPHLVTIPFDDAGGGIPYEETTIVNRERFDSFDVAVAGAVAGVIEDPSVMPLWRHARQAIARCGVAGCALAQARHGLEGELGLQTLELPLGVVCRTSSFAEFVLAIVTELPSFHRCYNDSTKHYRAVHGIRSSAHPVPNLSQDGDWFEAPLWIYGNDSPERRAAWVKLDGDALSISDRMGREKRVDVSQPKLAAEQLANLSSPNFKLRPRALVTTMYARLVLSDLFLHGIGGGKYDQLGDQIIRAFFGIEPPEFMVISATVQLPGQTPADWVAETRRVERALRDTVYQPERFADIVPLDPSLVQRKRSLLRDGQPENDGKAWHDAITGINAKLSEGLDSLRADLRIDLARAQQEASRQKLMSSREHPFCVYPLDYLTETYNQLLAVDGQPE